MFYTIQKADIGKKTIAAFSQVWWVYQFIGRILPSDVGKRVYKRNDILQVENNKQFSKRISSYK